MIDIIVTRTKESSRFALPQNCPVCNTKVEAKTNNEQINFYTLNCPSCGYGLTHHYHSEIEMVALWNALLNDNKFECIEN